MRRRNLFPDPSITGSLKASVSSKGKYDFIEMSGTRWLRAMLDEVTPNWQGYVQYSLTGSKVPPAGTYTVSLQAYADGLNGMARCYVLPPEGNYINSGAVVIPAGQTVEVSHTAVIPDACRELIIRICPGNTLEASAMMSDISIEPTKTYALASGGGFQASSPRRPRHTELEAGDRR